MKPQRNNTPRLTVHVEKGSYGSARRTADVFTPDTEHITDPLVCTFAIVPGSQRESEDVSDVHRRVPYGATGAGDVFFLLFLKGFLAFR